MEEKYYDVGNMNIDICLLTDLHFDIVYDLSIFDRIKESIKKHRPDFICLSGDIIDNSEVINSAEIFKLKRFIKELSEISQVIISLGNHELITKKKRKGDFELINNWFLKLNKMENVYYLNNKSLIRNNICFTGYNLDYEYYKKEDTKTFIDHIDKNIKLTKKYYNILLCHSPINVLKDSTLKYSEQIKKTDLILSGHMHNGLILKCFDKKGNFGLISPLKKPFPKHARNMVTKQIDNHKITLIISGGIIKFSNINYKIIRKLNFLYPKSIVYIKI